MVERKPRIRKGERNQGMKLKLSLLSIPIPKRRQKILEEMYRLKPARRIKNV